MHKRVKILPNYIAQKLYFPSICIHIQDIPAYRMSRNITWPNYIIYPCKNYEQQQIFTVKGLLQYKLKFSTAI